ncbi:MAG: hypothetical protein JAY90_20285 [Candidatus Thiodiazotropha lotti]|nr:hypothetical protein [Candidatus Thiodiazotropha lotti]MCG7985075.1 hypothetical protein [Candidatus Thiodiazotropha lotti]MCW4221803.1 hypothetical protein [Candidatus Thiodiazotropha lotti]
MPENSRWSDAELQKFRDEFEQHRTEFDQHRADEQEKWDEILTVVKDNAELSKKNAEGIEEMRKETRGLIDGWNTYVSGKKIAMSLGKIAKWLAQMAIFVSIYAWLTGHFPKLGGGGN